MSKYSVICSKGSARKGKILRKFAAVFVVLVIVGIFVCGWLYWKSMSPTILDIAQTKLIAATTKAINEAVCAVMSQYTSYADFVVVERNERNEISMLSANSALVNTLARNTAMLTQSKIDELAAYGLQIPFGSLTGIPLLSEKGNDVNISVTPIGAVTCTFTSTFQSQGVNQTLHRIFINVDSKIDLIIPSSHMVVENSTPILVCESIIVGSVPQTFVQGGLLLGSSHGNSDATE